MDNIDKLPQTEPAREISPLGRLNSQLKKMISEAIDRQFSFNGERIAQISHMDRVAQNVKSILGKEALAEHLTLPRETDDLVEAFAWGHDLGKFSKKEILQKAEELGEKGVAFALEKLGMTEEEKWIFGKAIAKQKEEEENIAKGMNPSYVREWDIAHNLLSAFYLEASNFLGEGANLPEKTKRFLTDMVIGHQFAGYYQDLARNLDWEERYIEAINAVSRFECEEDKVRLLLIKAAKAGDLEEMLLIGENKNGEFVPAGVTKIFLINIDLFLNKMIEEQKSSNLSYCFDRTKKSISQVIEDLRRLGIHTLDDRIREWEQGADNFLTKLSKSQIVLPEEDQKGNFQSIIEADLPVARKKEILYGHVLNFAKNWVKIGSNEL